LHDDYTPDGRCSSRYGAEFGGAQSASAASVASSSEGLVNAANGVLGQASVLAG
jgi:hypothetical protein